jgi:hypothetical protein
MLQKTNQRQTSRKFLVLEVFLVNAKPLIYLSKALLLFQLIKKKRRMINQLDSKMGNLKQVMEVANKSIKLISLLLS